MARSVPQPFGGPVRGSLTGRPIMALLDLLGRRWSLRIVWELRGGPLTARALRAACDDASPTVLQARLSELAGAGLVVNERPGGYRLTGQGHELMAAFEPLYQFAGRWGHTLAETAGEKSPASGWLKDKTKSGPS